MQDAALVQGGADGPVQAVFEVEGVSPLNHVREQVAKEGGILCQQRLKIQLGLGGDQIRKAHLARRNSRPVLGRHMAMVRVGAFVANSFEDHLFRLGTSPGYGN